MSYRIILLANLTFSFFCYGQENILVTNIIENHESLLNLENSLIKGDILLFSITGSSMIKTDSFPRPELLEIPLRKCTDNYVYFSKKGGIRSTTISVSIESDVGEPNRSIKEVRYIYYKFQVILPDSAIRDIKVPEFCAIGKINEKTNIHCCKVFQSKDKKRVYIYVINSEGANQYEVTWVIQNNKYFTRVIDKLRQK